MSDEKKKSKENEIDSTPIDGTLAPDTVPEKSPLKKILMYGGIGLVVFAVAIGAFSFMMGVFSSSPQTGDVSIKPADSTAVASEQKPIVEDTSDIDALEQKIFGEEKNVLAANDLDDIVRMADTMPAISAAVDSSTPAPVVDEKTKLEQGWADLEQKQKQLDQERIQVEQLMAKSSVMESSRITALARLYDGMKPAQVVPLITKLTDDQAVLVLLKMKSANAARVLGQLPAEAGARLSARMITLTEEK
ncbi:MAG: hypothetical protein PHR28_11715 [candidate division Zixibacteria bacterium]|nr:hypothetical protein [candidate division Zixibacteria bacterium]